MDRKISTLPFNADYSSSPRPRSLLHAEAPSQGSRDDVQFRVSQVEPASSRDMLEGSTQAQASDSPVNREQQCPPIKRPNYQVDTAVDFEVLLREAASRMVSEIASATRHLLDQMYQANTHLVQQVTAAKVSLLQEVNNSLQQQMSEFRQQLFIVKGDVAGVKQDVYAVNNSFFEHVTAIRDSLSQLSSCLIKPHDLAHMNLTGLALAHNSSILTEFAQQFTATREETLKEIHQLLKDTGIQLENKFEAMKDDILSEFRKAQDEKETKKEDEGEKKTRKRKRYD